MHKDYHHLDLFIYGYVHFWLFVCLDQPVVQNAHQETDEKNVPTSERVFQSRIKLTQD